MGDTDKNYVVFFFFDLNMLGNTRAKITKTGIHALNKPHL